MFQFTCPSRSTTWQEVPLRTHGKVSIHVPLAEHDSRFGRLSGLKPVSIHVPLAEHDLEEALKVLPGTSFNSRAPRGARPQHIVYRMMTNYNIR